MPPLCPACFAWLQHSPGQCLWRGPVWLDMAPGAAPHLAMPVLGQGPCWTLPADEEVGKKPRAEGLGRTRAGEPGSVRVTTDQGCPCLGQGGRDHRVSLSPSWQQGCLLRVWERVHCCWCFLGWLELPYQGPAHVPGDQHHSQWL